MLYGIFFKVLELADGTPASATAAVVRYASALEISAKAAIIHILGVILEFVVDVGKLRFVSVLHKGQPPLF
jgi:hypothetical protein